MSFCFLLLLLGADSVPLMMVANTTATTTTATLLKLRMRKHLKLLQQRDIERWRGRVAKVKSPTNEYENDDVITLENTQFQINTITNV